MADSKPTPEVVAAARKVILLFDGCYADEQDEITAIIDKAMEPMRTRIEELESLNRLSPEDKARQLDMAGDFVKQLTNQNASLTTQLKELEDELAKEMTSSIKQTEESIRLILRLKAADKLAEAGQQAAVMIEHIQRLTKIGGYRISTTDDQRILSDIQAALREYEETKGQADGK